MVWLMLAKHLAKGKKELELHLNPIILHKIAFPSRDNAQIRAPAKMKLTILINLATRNILAKNILR